MSDAADGALQGARRASPELRDGLARGCALFNRGDFWGSHEAWERSWHTAPEADRCFFQGLIQAAAACHKLVVQDNVVGAQRLAARALGHLATYPSDHHGLDVEGLRSVLSAWAARVSDGQAFGEGPLVGLPRIDWVRPARGTRLRVEEVGLFAIEGGSERAVLVEVKGGGAVGWGECRHRWGTYGLWDCLVRGLVPALLADDLASPGELSVAWQGLAEDQAAVAGVEAAVWDLWSRIEGLPLCVALGLPPRAIPLSLVVPAGDTDALAPRLDAACLDGYEMVVLPARPNADRRVVPSLAARCRLPFAVDLGAAYRLADIDALRVLDSLGPALMADPVKGASLASARRLRRWLTGPIGLSGWRSAASVGSAIELGCLDTIVLDPGLCGLTEAREIAAAAGEAGTGLWIVTSAATDIGAAADMAIAVHPNASMPAVLGTALSVSRQEAIRPGTDGLALPPAGPGIGREPDADWLARVTVRHTVLTG